MTNYSTTLLFSKDFVKDIECIHRIPPTSIGVRKIRPGNKATLKELSRQRRIKKEKRKRPLDDHGDGHGHGDYDDINCDQNEANIIQEQGQDKGIKRKYSEEQEDEKLQQIIEYSENQKKLYLQYNINDKNIQEEIAEMKQEDKRAYNNSPVLLSPPMTYQAIRNGLIPPQRNIQERNNRIKSNIVIDDDLATCWAKSLRKVIEIEEKKRNEEDIRALVYNIIPEPWNRLRSMAIIQVEDEKPNQVTEQSHKTQINENNSCSPNHQVIMCRNIRHHLSKQSHQSWYNKSHEIVFELLYNQFPSFHISCGSKFGCDYLIYDGCRMECHAFAGLRIVCVEPNDNNMIRSRDDSLHDLCFPLPTPYDLSGYVRGLNTAGKLALLAMVAQGESNEKNVDTDQSYMRVDYHVAIVDLALKKILTNDQNNSLKLKKKAKRQNSGKE